MVVGRIAFIVPEHEYRAIYFFSYLKTSFVSEFGSMDSEIMGLFEVSSN
jgi:hypothetical protein